MSNLYIPYFDLRFNTNLLSLEYNNGAEVWLPVPVPSGDIGLANGKLLVGNGSNVAAAVSLSGDATLANTGAITVTKINNAAPVSTATASTVVLRDASTNFAAGTITATLTGAINGVATNSNAGAGQVGEYVAAVAAGVGPVGSGSYGDVTSMSLTAGDWDVSVIATIQPQGSTITDFIIGVSTTTGNSGTGLVESVSKVTGGALSTNSPFSLPTVRFALTTTTTIYLKEYMDFSGGSGPVVSGGLTARRVR